MRSIPVIDSPCLSNLLSHWIVVSPNSVVPVDRKETSLSEIKRTIPQPEKFLLPDCLGAEASHLKRAGLWRNLCFNPFVSSQSTVLEAYYAK